MMDGVRERKLKENFYDPNFLAFATNHHLQP